LKELLVDNQTTQFLPFHAINEFMLDDYRLSVIRSTLSGLSGMPAEYREPVERLTKKFVQVPGFRISVKAPLLLRLKPTVDAFIKQPLMAVAILAAWAQSELDLRQQVYDLLASRGWEMLPADADRTKLPGFLPSWPKDENFEQIIAAFKESNPAMEASDNDISLMTVWLSGRLPYQTQS